MGWGCDFVEFDLLVALVWVAAVGVGWDCLSVMVVSLVVLDGGCVSVSPFVVIDGWVVVSVVDPLVFSGVSSVVSFDVFCEVVFEEAAEASSAASFKVSFAVFSSLMWVEALLVDAADEGSRLAAKAKLGVKAITLNNMAHATASAKDMKREGIFFCFMITLIY